MANTYTTYKDSGIPWIGEIPKEWKIGNFRYCGNFIKGKLPNHVNDDQKGLPIIGASEMLGKDFRTFTEDIDVPCCTEKDILILWDGANAGIIANGLYGVVSSTAVKYSCCDKNYNSQFVYYVLKSYESFFKSKVNGTTIPHMNIKYINEVPLFMPTLSEQESIANFLDEKCSEIDELISLQEKMIDELKAYKQSVITEAVTKGLDRNVKMKDSGVDWIGEIPEHWKLSTIGFFYFVTKLAGFEYTDIMVDKIKDTGDVPIVRAQNIRMFKFNNDITEFIDNETSIQLNRCALSRQALLMTFIGAGIGDVCKFEFDQRHHLAPNVAKLELTNEYKELIDDTFIMYFLGSNSGKGEIDRISKASAQASLSMSTIRKIRITIPTISEQQAIASFLDSKCLEIDSLISIKEKKIEELKDYKKSLIYEYVTGKKRV